VYNVKNIPDRTCE